MTPRSRPAGSARPAAALAVLALAPLAVAGAGCARPPQHPDVLLVTVDTLRADRTSVYGYGRETTPRLDEYAERGLVFTRVQSPRAKTTPAVASMLTGLYPHGHGVRDLASPIDARVPVLAEGFRDAGYRTIGIVGNWVLTDERSGLARGFDTWIEELPDQVGVPPDDVPQRRARSLTDAALAELDLSEPPAPRGQRRPWFCWLHYMDPHGLYDPPAEHRAFESEPDWLPAPSSFPPHRIHELRLARYNVPPSAETPDGRIDLAHVRDLYDGEIRYVDAEIGRLFDALADAGRFDEALVVVTADHGESLGEHRYWFEHGFYTYEVTCRVPLLVWLPTGPDGAVRGAPERYPGRRGSDVSLADLAPTVLELAGIRPLPPVPGDFVGGRSGPHGLSVVDVVLGGPERRRPVFSEKIERADVSGTVQHKSVRIGDWKLIHRLAKLPGTDHVTVLTEELYDLERDPGETANLAADPPEAAPYALLTEALARFTDADTHLGELSQLLQRRREELEREDPEALRFLEALGY